MKILIVDDHPVIIAGCSAMFAAEGGYDVVDAGDADEGYEAYLKHKPELCILDISLPGKSGFDLTRRILEQNKKAKIIIFSMNDDPVFASRALNLFAMSIISIAFETGIARGSLWVPPAPGMIAHLTSVKPKVASSDAIFRSQASAISVPPARQKPFIAAMMGFEVL